MTQIYNIETRTYQDGDFLVEISFNGETHEAWIWHKNYGTKMHMFGLVGSNWAEIEETAENELPYYKEDYAEQYMDD